jgi:hypothetical protein
MQPNRFVGDDADHRAPPRLRARDNSAPGQQGSHCPGALLLKPCVPVYGDGGR